MKKVLEMVVGMIINRACAKEGPDRKRARIEGNIQKIITYISIDIMYHRHSPKLLYLYLHVLIKFTRFFFLGKVIDITNCNVHVIFLF